MKPPKPILTKMKRLSLAVIPFAIGVFFILGAYSRWKWLVDPPTGGAWIFYSQSAIKMLFGAKATLYWTYGCGLFALAAGLKFLTVGP